MRQVYARRGGAAQATLASNLSKAIVVQLLSRVRLFAIPWTAACQTLLSSTISRSLLKFMSIKSVTLSNHFILCCPFLLWPSIFPSIRVFSNELALCIRWPEYWSFSFSISPSNEYSGLISFRIDWLDLLAVQGTFQSLLQTTFLKHQFFSAHFLYGPSLTSIHDHLLWVVVVGDTGHSAHQPPQGYIFTCLCFRL